MNRTNPMKEWRKKLADKGGKVISLNLSPDTVVALNKFCDKHNVTQTQAIVHAILSL